MKLQHLVNCSSGKDSTACYLLAIESGREFSAVFADTQNEHPAVYEYLAQLPARTGGPPIRTVKADFTERLERHRTYILEKWPTLGIPDEKVQMAAELNRPTGNLYLDLCILKGRFPSRKAQFCTEELKTIPITDQVVLPMLRTGPVLQWLGIRADESENRAKQPRFNRVETGAMVWRPIFRWTAEDTFALHRKHGIPRNPLYDQGFTRVGCFPCINCRKEELRLISDRFPEHIDRIERWEAIVAAASKLGSATFFPALTDPTDPDTPNEYSRIRKLVEWSKTTRGGRQYGMFFDQQPGGGCTSDLGLCER
jgi:3'-phosphoadenosine 5'-phosphosulfate sulfotransferase (PAPS reductase)/FAD synthetase